ncbi:MAG: hypothetical protein AVDCRST_MAG66-1509, partial [uncultured Pseudonocardia sp.]
EGPARPGGLHPARRGAAAGGAVRRHPRLRPRRAVRAPGPGPGA